MINTKHYLTVAAVTACGWVFGFIIYNSIPSEAYQYFHLNTVVHAPAMRANMAHLQLRIPEHGIAVPVEPIRPFAALPTDATWTESIDYPFAHSQQPMTLFNQSQLPVGHFFYGMEFIVENTSGIASRYQLEASQIVSIRELLRYQRDHSGGLYIITELSEVQSIGENKRLHMLYAAPIVSFYT